MRRLINVSYLLCLFALAGCQSTYYKTTEASIAEADAFITAMANG